jgi:hypothetical protein
MINVQELLQLGLNHHEIILLQYLMQKAQETGETEVRFQHLAKLMHMRSDTVKFRLHSFQHQNIIRVIEEKPGLMRLSINENALKDRPQRQTGAIVDRLFEVIEAYKPGLMPLRRVVQFVDALVAGGHKESLSKMLMK